MQERTELRVALSITVALVAVGCGSDPNRTLDPYRSATYGYTIEHPSGWTVVAAARQLQDGEPPRTGGGGTDIFARHARRKVRDMDLPVLVVGAQPIAATTHIGDWAEEVSTTVSHQKGLRPGRGNEGAHRRQRGRGRAQLPPTARLAPASTTDGSRSCTAASRTRSCGSTHPAPTVGRSWTRCSRASTSRMDSDRQVDPSSNESDGSGDRDVTT